MVKPILLFQSNPNVDKNFRPVSIPSSSGADFPELPKFENDISFGFGDGMSAVKNVANSFSRNMKQSKSKLNYQEDAKKPDYEDDNDDEADYERHPNQEHLEQDRFGPENFGPQPIDYEPESPYEVPAAPPAFSSIDSADFELSPEGQGKMFLFNLLNKHFYWSKFDTNVSRQTCYIRKNKLKCYTVQLNNF